MSDLTNQAATETAPTEETLAAPQAAPEEERNEEDAVWDALEAAERGETPTATQESADKPPDATDEEGDKPTGQAAEGEDIWKDAPEALRSAHDAERQRADRAEQALKSRDGREAALQRRLDALIAGEGRSPEAPATRQPSADDSANTELVRQVETLKADYPEFTVLADAVTQLMVERTVDRETINRLTLGLETIGEDRYSSALDEQESIVRETHPDYDDIANSEEFVTWAKDQPEFVKAGIIANVETIVDGDGVTWILDQYKRDRGIESGKDGGSAAGTRNPGKKQPAADPIRTIQQRSATGTPPSTAGAAVPEEERTLTESEDDVWDEIERKEQQRLEAAA